MSKNLWVCHTSEWVWLCRSYDCANNILVQICSTNTTVKNLYRYFIESNETFANLQKNAPFSDVNPANTHCEILARNILDFQITPLTASTNGFTNWTHSPSTPTPDLVELKIVGLNNERSHRFNARNDQAAWDTLRGETNASDYLKNTKTFTTRVKLNRQ